MSVKHTQTSFPTAMSQEWRRLVREPAFWPVVLLLAGLMVIAGIHGHQEAQRIEIAANAIEARQARVLDERRSMAAEMEQDSVANASPWDARSAWGAGRYRGIDVATPPAPLVALAIGQSDLTPAAHRVDTGPVAMARPDSRLANPLRLSAGHFDIAFVVLYLVPLLLIALLFDLVATDRESGVLRLLVGGPLRVSRLVLARAAVRGGSVLCAVSVAILVAGAISGQPGGRLALFVGVTLLYGAFWVALCAVVNASGRSSAANAVVLAGAWILLVVVLPATTHTAAKTTFPSPSRATYIGVQRAANAEGLRESREAMSRFFDNHPDLAGEVGENETSYVMAATARDEAVSQEMRPLLQADSTRRARRERFLSAVNLASPTLLAHHALLEAAGTGSGRQAFIEQQLAGFRATWSAWFLPRYFRGNDFKAVDYDSMPRFELGQEPIARSVSQASLSLVGLLLWFAAVFFGAFRLFTRPLSMMEL